MKSEIPHIELPDDKERRRRLTNVVYSLAKDTARADDRAARAKNILKGAEENPGLERLLNKKSLFYNEQEGLPTAVHLESEFEFLKEAPEFQQMSRDATAYIENLPLINRGEHTETVLPQKGTIKELAEMPYDITRVKLWEVAGKKFVIKRVIRGKVADDLEEYRKTQQAATLSIPTHRPVGYVKDRGNTYLIFEYLENTISAFELSQRKIQISDRSSFKPMDFSISLYDIARYDPKLGIEVELRYYEELLAFLNFLIVLFFCIKQIINDRSSLVQLVEVIKVKMDDFRSMGQWERMLLIFRDEFNVDFIPPVSVNSKSEAKVWFDNLKNQLAKSLGNNFLLRMSKVKNRFKKRSNEYHDSLSKKYIPLLERRLCGASISFPYRDFVEKVERKIEEAGLKATDLNKRNILIKMDKDGERILPNKDGDAQFYVIDWE